MSSSQIWKNFILAAVAIFLISLPDIASAAECNIPKPSNLDVTQWEFDFGPYQFPSGLTPSEVFQAFSTAIDPMYIKEQWIHEIKEMLLSLMKLPLEATEMVLFQDYSNCNSFGICRDDPYDTILKFIEADVLQASEGSTHLILNCDSSSSYAVYLWLEQLNNPSQPSFTSSDLIPIANHKSTTLAELFTDNSAVTTMVTDAYWRSTSKFDIFSNTLQSSGKPLGAMYLDIEYATEAEAEAESNPLYLRIVMQSGPVDTEYGSGKRDFSEVSAYFRKAVGIFQALLPYSFGSVVSREDTSTGTGSSLKAPSASSTNTTSTDDSSSGSSTSVGLIVGVVAGVLVAVAVVAAISLFILKKKRKRHEAQASSSAVYFDNPHQPPPAVIIQESVPLPFPHQYQQPVPAELPSKSPLLPSELPPPSVLSNSTTSSNNNTVSMARSPFMDSMLTTNNSQVKNDPILSWVVASGMAKSDVTTTSSAGGRAVSHRSGSSGPVDIRPWQMQFDELRIIKVVGEGSFGRVYLATWHETNVAVKVLLDNSITQSQAAALSLSSPILQKLEAEGSLLASLRHPNIVNFMGVCTFPPAIVTEYCARGSLTDVLKMAKDNADFAQYLTWPRRIAMLTDAAQGMLFLHKHRPPIIHRDLKSPNLLVTEHFKVQISDFNLSKIIEEATATSVAQQTSNSGANNPRWLAVECLSGGRASEASDVFSFGVIMWEMLTFSIPWTGQTNPWSIVRIICDGGRLDTPAKADVPGGADSKMYKGYDGYVALMNKCWAQEPAERPDFGTVIAALKKLA